MRSLATRAELLRRAEFGDFQTPADLARKVCALLARRGARPASIIEPTCGTGSFLLAGLEQFDSTKRAVGLDINAGYLRSLRATLRKTPHAGKTRLYQGNFFDIEWPRILQDLPGPLLVIGNPPWVTNAELGSLGSTNLPVKSNFKNHSGLEALTGKSNFDISEWMLLRLLQWLRGREGTIAMLCKTSVARKALEHSWRHSQCLDPSAIYEIHALKHFGAAVDACLLVCSSFSRARAQDCAVYPALDSATPKATIGYRNGRLTADTTLYERWHHLDGREVYKWRSGIKHDCAKVLELREEGKSYINGLGEHVDIEDTYVYPALKGSDVANGRARAPSAWMLVTQHSIAEDTKVIEQAAPKTWAYLNRHARFLDRRASSIYKNRPRFCIFGVGDYTFAPWKVAVCGFYKTFTFTVIGPHSGRPMVLDDTSYFLACRSRAEAEYILSLLTSSAAQEFYRALVFWDAKRPITLELLRRLDFVELARALGSEETILKYLHERPVAARGHSGQGNALSQRALF